MSATYDFDAGLVTSITNPKGDTTSFEFDILGRVIKKINPDLTEKEAVYDDLNNTVTIYDELDHYTMKYYDGLGRLTKIELYLSPTEKLTKTYTYDYLNKVKTRTDFGGHIYFCEYDSRGRMTRIWNPDSTFRQIQYNDTTNTLTFFDENMHKKEYDYDWLGNLLWVKEYTDSQNYYLTQYMYDSAGNLTSVTDANGNTTFYNYGSLFGVTQITYPNSSTETFSYDDIGNLLQRTDGSGTTTFIYNAIYQLTEIMYPDSTATTFQYDLNGNRTLMTDSEGQTSYTYDNRNRLLSKTRTIEGESYTVSYLYDAASRITSIVYPDQSIVTYEYDSVDRLASVPGYAEFTYDADSLLANLAYSNGVVTDYQYDNRDRAVTIHAQKDGTDLLLMNYQYDPVGNITQLNYNRRLPDQQWVQSVDIYQYDWLDRLVSVQGDYGSLSYSYDPVGNRLSQNDLAYTYNNMNELLSITDGTTFTYDEMGNTLTRSDGTDIWSYTYDSKNKLTEVEKNQQVIAQYSYSGGGKRIQKTEWVEDLQEYQTTIYIYSGLQVIYEKNLTTDQEATYVYGPTGRIAKKVNGLTNYYHTDHLGSIRLMTTESGTTITTVAYKSFGQDTVTGEKSSYTYNGKEKDSAGLYYYGARYYDPEIGRFMTRDTVRGTIEDPRTMNRYVYCLNNPLRFIDLDGHQAHSRYKFTESTSEISPEWQFFYTLLMQIKFFLIATAEWKGFVDAHSTLAACLGTTTVGGIVGGLLEATGIGAKIGSIGGPPGIALGAVSAFIGFCITLFINMICEEYGDFWNDPEFRDLYNSLLEYTWQISKGYDVGQEWLDTLVELIVEAYKVEYGENWRSYCPQEIQDYYDALKETQSGANPDPNPPQITDPNPPQITDPNPPQII